MGNYDLSIQFKLKLVCKIELNFFVNNYHNLYQLPLLYLDYKYELNLKFSFFLLVDQILLLLLTLIQVLVFCFFSQRDRPLFRTHQYIYRCFHRLTTLATTGLLLHQHKTSLCWRRAFKDQPIYFFILVSSQDVPAWHYLQQLSRFKSCVFLFFQRFFNFPIFLQFQIASSLFLFQSPYF